MLKGLIKKFIPTLKPSFILLGAQKAGTTSFYKYLDFHPDFLAACRKEIHFFDLNYNKGVNWYHRHFPKKNFNPNSFTGEASPYYLFHPLVPERVFKYSPRIKFVILLRDPVERAYSQYCMNINRGVEKLTFAEAIEEEEARLENEIEKIKSLGNYNSFNHQSYSYLSRGKYAKQLRDWMKFFQKEQFLIVRDKELKQAPQQVFDIFCDFIEVKRFAIPNTLQLNSYSDASLPIEIKERLYSYFSPYNKDLKALINIDLNE